MSRVKFKQKVCLISGGSSGIGLAIAQSLKNNGYEVISFSKSKKVIADVTNDKDISRVVNYTLKKFGRIDVLINAAGVFEPFGNFEEVPFKSHLKPLEINLFGTMRVCHFVIPIMKKNKFGRIINFSGGGVGGDIIPVNSSSYFTSKAAIAVFTEILAYELQKFNITVNAILPGQILTKSTKKTLNLSKEQLGPVLWEATQNLKKTGGGSTEPAINLINFLISEKASHVSGKLLSAKWDSVDKLMDLKKQDADYKYTLRRIEGNLYKKV